MTLSQWLMRYIDRRLGLKKISETTAANYRLALADLLKAKGAQPLAAITADDIEDFYIARLKTVSPATLRTAHIVLEAAFEAAVAAGHIAKSPMEAVEENKAETPEKKALDGAQIKALLAYAADKPLVSRILRLAIATGLRRGELAALVWGDIDFDAGTLTVARTIVKVGKIEVEKAPKSRAGLRTVTLPADLLADLRKAKGAADEPVLRTQQGRRPSLAYLSEVVKSALRAIGCDEGFSLHSTRHTHATHAIRATRNLKAVSKRLGHADVRFTLKVYAKVLGEDDADVARAINGVMAA